MLHPGGHRQQIIQQRGLMVGDLRRMHHKEDAVFARELSRSNPCDWQQLGARAFHEREVVGVEHHAACVGMLVVDAKRPGEVRVAGLPVIVRNSAPESDRFGAVRPGGVGRDRRDAPARGALQIALLDEIGLE